MKGADIGRGPQDGALQRSQRKGKGQPPRVKTFPAARRRGEHEKSRTLVQHNNLKVGEKKERKVGIFLLIEPLAHDG